jgi:hypothetical protein
MAMAIPRRGAASVSGPASLSSSPAAAAASSATGGASTAGNRNSFVSAGEDEDEALPEDPLAPAHFTVAAYNALRNYDGTRNACRHAVFMASAEIGKRM